MNIQITITDKKRGMLSHSSLKYILTFISLICELIDLNEV